ncbi:unnamed protein product, partial [marine sediment metagenome]
CVIIVKPGGKIQMFQNFKNHTDNNSLCRLNGGFFDSVSEIGIELHD